MSQARDQTDRPLRIAVLNHATLGAGAVSVSKNLILALGRAGPRNEYLITLHRELGLEESCRSVPNSRIVLAGPWGSMAGRWWWDAVTLPRLIRRYRPDVILDLCGRGLVRPACPQAVLMQRPGVFYPSRHYARDTFRVKLTTWVLRRHLRRSLPHTDLLLCQTPVAAERMKAAYSYGGRIELCPNAVSQFTAAGAGNRQAPRALGGCAGTFKLFCLTAYYAHKNLEAIVDLFRAFPKELADVAVVLTIAADQHRNAPKLLRSIQRHGLSSRIVNVGPLRQEELAGYYANCQALFLPTLMESFTATYLEAMHFGVPILTSDLDFARAVCGEAAVYFDPWDPRSIKDAILRLKGDPALSAGLIAAGRARLQATHRSWDEVAGDVLRWLREITSKAGAYPTERTDD